MKIVTNYCASCRNPRYHNLEVSARLSTWLVCCPLHEGPAVQGAVQVRGGALPVLEDLNHVEVILLHLESKNNLTISNFLLIKRSQFHTAGLSGGKRREGR